PSLRMILHGRNPAFTLDAVSTAEIIFSTEAQRGYESKGDRWSPGYLCAELTVDEPVTLVASAESWETLLAMSPEEALRAERGRRARLVASAGLAARGELTCGPALPAAGPEVDSAGDAFDAELVLTADQFLITPAGRVEDAARAHASGEEVRTVIAG